MSGDSSDAEGLSQLHPADSRHIGGDSPKVSALTGNPKETTQEKVQMNRFRIDNNGSQLFEAISRNRISKRRIAIATISVVALATVLGVGMTFAKETDTAASGSQVQARASTGASTDTSGGALSTPGADQSGHRADVLPRISVIAQYTAEEEELLDLPSGAFVADQIGRRTIGLSERSMIAQHTAEEEHLPDLSSGAFVADQIGRRTSVLCESSLIAQYTAEEEHLPDLSYGANAGLTR
jgi:hypothetical protein